MEDNRKEQIEALEVLVDFNEKLVHNVGILVKELSGARLDDTDKLMKAVLDAMNWEIQVMNGTMDLLNAGKDSIDKEAFNAQVLSLGDAVKSKDDVQMAKAFEEICPYFEQLGRLAKEAIA